MLQITPVVGLCVIVGLWIASSVYSIFYNLYLHPLKRFPGPWLARASFLYKAWSDIFGSDSGVPALLRLHKQYGDVVRIAPDHLHFADPSAYQDIYNNSARWDKEELLYHSFGEDTSLFGFLKYQEAKQRRDVLQPLFSRRAILNMQGLVQRNIHHFCDKLVENHDAGKSADLFLGIRCFTLDTITTFCFARSVSAMDQPDFKAPLVLAMEATDEFHAVFKNSPFLRKLVLGLPTWLSERLSPETKGFVDLATIVGSQVKAVCADPSLLDQEPTPTIYQRLLDPAAQKGHEIASPESLYHEAQSLMFAGTDTVANALFLGVFFILSDPSIYERLTSEVTAAWPNLTSQPSLEELEKLPYLTAVLKESLRHSHGPISPMLRVTPATTSVNIAGHEIPPRTVVGISNVIVHTSPKIFSDPNKFFPDRWLGSDAGELDKWMVSFGRGPRSCIGINLGWSELYFGMATLIRRFDMQLDGTTKEDLVWKDTFLPHFTGRHLKVWCKPVKQ